MCTAFIHRGDDYLAGFNFDVDPAVWQYKLIMNPQLFYIGIRMGRTLYKTHGVNCSGQFGVLPYRNGPVETKLHRGGRYQRLDLLDGRWIAGDIDYVNLESILEQKEIVDAPGCSMHALFSDAPGHIMLVEPGSGHISFEKQAVVGNFPLIERPSELSGPFYGAERYETACRMLETENTFRIEDGLALLQAAAQTGQWATRISFLYSGNENCVFYCLNGDFSIVKRHDFS